jgi:hypothetical protein
MRTASPNGCRGVAFQSNRNNGARGTERRQGDWNESGQLATTVSN